MEPYLRITVTQKEQPSHAHLFRKPLVVIGKQESADLNLQNRLVSRQHALVRFDKSTIEYEDLESTNGSLYQGKPVRQTTLNHGDEIQVGPYRLTFEIAEDLTPLLAECYKKVIAEPPGDDFEKSIRENAERIVEETCGKSEHAKTIFPRLIKELLHYGPIDNLLNDPSITEIMVNNWNQIFIERSGEISLIEEHFSCGASLKNCIDRILTPTGRRLDEASPMVDARLPDGSRVNIVIPPISLNGPTLTIRKFSRSVTTLEELIKLGSLPEEQAELLHEYVHSRKNIIITGGTGTGKTTMLNALASTIPHGERLITIEDAAELQLNHPHLIRLESRPANIEGVGEIPIRQLVKNGLRMRPDRIIVGECRGSEALDMLQAMNTGHPGSLTTLHANTPADGLRRLETMILMAEVGLPLRAIRQQISSAIDFVVQLGRRGRDRVLDSIAEVCHLEGEVIAMRTIYRADPN